MRQPHNSPHLTINVHLCLCKYIAYRDKNFTQNAWRSSKNILILRHKKIHNNNLIGGQDNGKDFITIVDTVNWIIHYIMQ